MSRLARFWLWMRNKAGRLITGLGGLVALADIDISPVKDELEGWISHKGVQLVTVTLFVASYLRHHWVASQHPVSPGSPPPAPSEAGKA